MTLQFERYVKCINVIQPVYISGVWSTIWRVRSLHEIVVRVDIVRRMRHSCGFITSATTMISIRHSTATHSPSRDCIRSYVHTSGARRTTSTYFLCLQCCSSNLRLPVSCSPWCYQPSSSLFSSSPFYPMFLLSLSAQYCESFAFMTRPKYFRFLRNFCSKEQAWLTLFSTSLFLSTMSWEFSSTSERYLFSSFSLSYCPRIEPFCSIGKFVVSAIFNFSHIEDFSVLSTIS